MTYSESTSDDDSKYPTLFTQSQNFVHDNSDLKNFSQPFHNLNTNIKSAPKINNTPPNAGSKEIVNGKHIRSITHKSFDQKPIYAFIYDTVHKTAETIVFWSKSRKSCASDIISHRPNPPTQTSTYF